MTGPGITGVILEHAFGKRYELPVPLGLFVVGGAAVVIFSFVLVSPRAVRLAAPTSAPAPGGRRRLGAASMLGVAVLAALVACGLVGSQVVAENILPVSFWLLAWIAVPLSCGILGDWTQALNPFATLARVADNPRLRGTLLGQPEALNWPRSVGWWPAVAVFFAAACGELVFNVTATVPHVLAIGLAMYAVISAVGGLLFGPAWLVHGELFSVLYGTWGRLGYGRFGAAGPRGFAGGLQEPFSAAGSRIAFVLLLLISVNFDGLLATPAWASLEHRVPLHLDLAPWRLQVFRAGDFTVLALVTIGVFGAFAVLSARAGRRREDARDSLAGLAPSLVPIAFGYLLAHNIEYLAVNSQLLLPLLGNPAGLSGWPRLPYPFNDSYEPNIHLLPSAAYWYFSIAVIIAVHVVAVVLAHQHLAGSPWTERPARLTGGRADRLAVRPGYQARRRAPALAALTGAARTSSLYAATPSLRNRSSTGPTAMPRRRADLGRRSEYPWLVAMVAYTMFSLWLIAQPLAK